MRAKSLQARRRPFRVPESLTLPQAAGSKWGLGSPGPISLRSFQSPFSAFLLFFFLGENSHLFQHSDFIKLGILKACFVFESELFGACRQGELSRWASPSRSGLPWCLTVPLNLVGRPPFHPQHTHKPQGLSPGHPPPHMTGFRPSLALASLLGFPRSVPLQEDSFDPFPPGLPTRFRARFGASLPAP